MGNPWEPPMTSPKDGWIGWSGTSGVQSSHRFSAFHGSQKVGHPQVLSLMQTPQIPENRPLDLDHNLHKPNQELIYIYIALNFSAHIPSPSKKPNMVPKKRRDPKNGPRHNDSGFMTGLTPDMFVAGLQVWLSRFVKKG